MNYNYFPGTHQVPAYYPSQVNNSFPYQQQAQQGNGIIWVQGEVAAKSYLVAPGNTVALFDNEAQTIYIKSADAAGMPTMKILDYKVRNEASPAGQIEAHSEFATKEDISLIKDEINALRAKFGEMEGKKK